MVDFEVVKLNTESFSKLTRRLQFNDVIAGYYRDLDDETRRQYKGIDDSLLRKADRVETCSKTWDVLWHRLQGYKGVLNAGLCRDKFCVNCQSALAKARESKYFPMLSELSLSNSIYHIVFTIPNCSGVCLKNTVNRLFESLPCFLKYLRGQKKLKGFTFDYLGYKGCIRSLEVTYNKKEKTYHPHLHCLLVLNKDLDLDSRKVLKNSFSYSRDHSEVKFFSDEEVLFQKIWYLLCNGIKVNKENLDNVDIGYSVSASRSKDSDYKEVFKYAFKGDLNSGEDDNSPKCLSYDNFKDYLGQLSKKRFIQGYGCFLNYEFENVELTDDLLDLEFYEFMAELNSLEVPVQLYEDKDVMISNMESGLYKYYSKSSIKKFFLDEKIKELHGR